MNKSDNSLELLIEQVLSCHDIESAKDILYSVTKPTGMLLKAVNYCINLHEGQVRKSGEPYSVHPILVTSFVAHMGGDESMLIAALLHDVVEDTECSKEDVAYEFNEEIAKLVDGLTKVTEIRKDELVSSDSNEKLAASAMSFRKMLINSIEDVRVLIIKLCDRLHNMLTLDALRPDKQRRIAEETLIVYAPIAHRLGISAIKNVLEDLAFKYVMPEEYAKIDDFINSSKQQLQLKINSFSQKVSDELLANGFSEDSFEIQKRIKHYYSIYLKMQRKGISLEEILDLLAVRIIVQDDMDCYLVLGLLHTNFSPLISRFKDYIALPKQNGYRTLHTTLFDDKSIIEAQIRTFNMHKTAEYGVAAHWRYKQSGSFMPSMNKWLEELKDDVNKNTEGIEDFYQNAKDSLYVEDIAVYSPAGRPFTLPRGATALDYAYEIHSEIGLHAKDAYVNKIKVPLLTELRNGDIVQIIAGDEPKYRCSWLDNVKTGKARATIRAHCRQKLKDVNLAVAHKILCAVFGINDEKLDEWLEAENLSKKVYKIATDSVFFQDVVNALKKYPRKEKIFGFANKYEIRKQKCDNIVIYSNYKINRAEFDYCCNPKRGDDIIGFRTSHSVTVHHKLCERANKLIANGDEMIFVKWAKNAPNRYKIILNIENKRGSLANFLSDLAKQNMDLVTITLNEGAEDESVEYFELIAQVPQDADVSAIKDKLKDKYKIIEWSSLADAYS